MRNRREHCGGRAADRRMGQFLDPVLLLLLKETPAHGYTLLGQMADFGLDFLNPTVIYRALREMERARLGHLHLGRKTRPRAHPPRLCAHAFRGRGTGVLRGAASRHAGNHPTLPGAVRRNCRYHRAAGNYNPTIIF
jgi:hypothetical protein